MSLAAVQCELCGKTFSKRSSLLRHGASFHSSQPKIFTCTNCNYSSKRKENLKRHSEKCKKNGLDRPFQKTFQCSNCSANYGTKSSLDRHEQKHHCKRITQRTLIYKRKCPLCPFESSDHKLKNMYSHFDKVHNICLQWENHTFVSVDEFYDWKNQVERLVGSNYILKSKSKNTIVFNCRRCGIYKSSGKNKRTLKSTGTCKINGFCPAYIKMKIRNDCIFALYQRVHVGHEHELKYQRLTKEDRNYLASMLVEKVPHEEILKNIRESMANSELRRIHLIKKKDLANMERRLNLNQETICDPFDPISIDSWMVDISQSEDTALLLYQEQEEATENFPKDSQDDSENLEKKRKLLLLELNKLEVTLKDELTTSDQLDLILKTINPLNKTIEDMKSSSNSLQVTAEPNNPANTIVINQRPLRTVQEVLLSEEETENVALEVVIEMDGSLTLAEPTALSIENSDHLYYCKQDSADEEDMQL